jgi:hypothetical protein
VKFAAVRHTTRYKNNSIKRLLPLRQRNDEAGETSPLTTNERRGRLVDRTSCVCQVTQPDDSSKLQPLTKRPRFVPTIRRIGTQPPYPLVMVVTSHVD